MRVAAQWTESREGFPEDFEPAWLWHRLQHGRGRRLADHRLDHSRRGRPAEAAKRVRRRRLRRAVGVISILLLIAYVIAIWAMTAKPT